MKKAAIFLLTLFFLIGSASLVVASNNAASLVHGKNIPELKMTDNQKAKMISLKIQLLELKKQIIKENVQNGTITQEQAKKMEERINSSIQALKSGKLDQGFHRHHPQKNKQDQKTQ